MAEGVGTFYDEAHKALYVHDFSLGRSKYSDYPNSDDWAIICHYTSGLIVGVTLLLPCPGWREVLGPSFPSKLMRAIDAWRAEDPSRAKLMDEDEGTLEQAQEVLEDRAE